MIRYTEIKFRELQQLANYNDKTSIAKQVRIVQELSGNHIGNIELLLNYLLNRKLDKNWFPNCVDGLIYEILIQELSPRVQNKLKKVFKHGIVPLRSERSIDYLILQKLLIDKQFQKADILTHKKLCELSNLQENQRSWLYFTDIFLLPITDLHTINSLWIVHSQNRFGFSIQREIWLSGSKDWEKLWDTIGWRVNHVLCRYPNEFQWNINGPLGHLPLFNQLRGVQVLSALFHHKAWKGY